jgi:hypothetical protein
MAMATAKMATARVTSIKVTPLVRFNTFVVIAVPPWGLRAGTVSGRAVGQHNAVSRFPRPDAGPGQSLAKFITITYCTRYAIRNANLFGAPSRAPIAFIQ